MQHSVRLIIEITILSFIQIVEVTAMIEHISFIYGEYHLLLTDHMNLNIDALTHINR